jgi:hypothetical protein
MRTERKNPVNRDQALNDVTSSQLGEEPKLEPSRRLYESKTETDNNITNAHVRAARRVSRYM